jgi:hypothetical protein
MSYEDLNEWETSELEGLASDPAVSREMRQAAQKVIEARKPPASDIPALRNPDGYEATGFDGFMSNVNESFFGNGEEIIEGLPLLAQGARNAWNKPRETWEAAKEGINDHYAARWAYGNTDVIGENFYNDPVGMMLDVSPVGSLMKGGAAAARLGVKGANAAIPDLKPQVLNTANQSLDAVSRAGNWIESLDPYSGMVDMARLGTYGLREKQAADYVVNDYRGFPDQPAGANTRTQRAKANELLENDLPPSPDGELKAAAESDAAGLKVEQAMAVETELDNMARTAGVAPHEALNVNAILGKVIELRTKVKGASSTKNAADSAFQEFQAELLDMADQNGFITPEQLQQLKRDWQYEADLSASATKEDLSGRTGQGGTKQGDRLISQALAASLNSLSDDIAGANAGYSAAKSNEAAVIPGAKFNLSNANEPLNDRLLNILAKTADYSLTGQNKYNQAQFYRAAENGKLGWLDALIDKSSIGPVGRARQGAYFMQSDEEPDDSIPSWWEQVFGPNF